MKVKLIVCLLILSLVPIASAQFEVPEWELGWDTDMGTTYEIALDVDDWDSEDVIVAFLDNPRNNEVSVDLTYEFSDEDFPFEIDAPESLSVSGGSNDTFEITITSISDSVKVREYSPNQAVTLTVTADEVVAGSGQSRSTQDIDGDLRPSKEHKLAHHIAESDIEVDAGTWIEVTLQIENLGNYQDAVTESSHSVRMCPHLDIEQLESVEGQVLRTTGNGGDQASAHGFTIRVSASSSASAKSCEVSISLTSEGSGEIYTNSFDVDVSAVESGSSNTNLGNSDDEEQEMEGENSNATPFVGIMEIISLLAIISLSRRM